MLARQIAFEMRPVLGSPGETCLRDARRINTSAIEDVLERTNAIGWHPAVYFNEPGHALHGRKLGCIIAVMTDPVTAEPTGAISRTYIHEGRKLGKAKTLGSPAGIVRLCPHRRTARITEQRTGSRRRHLPLLQSSRMSNWSWQRP
jgi:hypothetical protein